MLVLRVHAQQWALARLLGANLAAATHSLKLPHLAAALQWTRTPF
jgi:hypothetical protein